MTDISTEYIIDNLLDLYYPISYNDIEKIGDSYVCYKCEYTTKAIPLFLIHVNTKCIRSNSHEIITSSKRKLTREQYNKCTKALCRFGIDATDVMLFETDIKYRGHKCIRITINYNTLIHIAEDTNSNFMDIMKFEEAAF